MILHLTGAAIQIDHLACIQYILPSPIQDQRQLLKQVASVRQIYNLVQFRNPRKTISQVNERTVKVLALLIDFFPYIDELLE